jgi:lysophospholipid acyltransferase (LPLAT)-like uncharacterized protein
MSRTSKTIIKKFLHHIAYFYIKMLFATYRLEETCKHNFKKPLHLTNGVFYFWHQNVIASLFFFFKKKAYCYCIIQKEGTGEILGFIAKKLGFKVIYTKKIKTPLQTTRKTLEVLDVNKKIIVTGNCYNKPKHKLQRWVIYIAAKSRLPLIFIDFKSKSAINFHKYHEKIHIPLPFSKIKIKMHNPVIPSVDAYKRQ